MIEIKHLTKTFETSDGKLDALNDVSLKIDDGEIYGIIGMRTKRFRKDHPAPLYQYA